VALCLTPCALHDAPAQQASPPTAPAPARRLFGADDPLPLTLATDWNAVLKDRGTPRHLHDGVLNYRSSGGDSVALGVTLRTRGHFRLKREICDFPPLKVDFDRTQIAATVFRHTGSLKLATHCRDSRSFEEYALEEYLIYRLFNLLTERSFEVRLAHVTYLDTAHKRDSLTRYGFFIEDDDRMARRTHTHVIKSPGIPQQMTDSAQIGLIAVFEYMIANTDWSVAGLHNIVLTEDTSGTMYAVPYDFDWSGVISTPYARPDARLGITSVRQRLFRGYCRSADQFAAIFARFNDRKDAIYTLYRSQVGTDPKRIEQTLRFYDDFYRIINDPKLVRREFLQPCKE
jgi:hypothetical protein